MLPQVLYHGQEIVSLDRESILGNADGGGVMGRPAALISHREGLRGQTALR